LGQLAPSARVLRINLRSLGRMHTLLPEMKMSLNLFQIILGFTFTVADVLEDGFIDKIKSDTSEFNINGLAYCIGSIDLKTHQESD
jgi:hypothetical protein